MIMTSFLWEIIISDKSETNRFQHGRAQRPTKKLYIHLRSGSFSSKADFLHFEYKVQVIKCSVYIRINMFVREIESERYWMYIYKESNNEIPKHRLSPLHLRCIWNSLGNIGRTGREARLTLFMLSRINYCFSFFIVDIPRWVLWQSRDFLSLNSYIFLFLFPFHTSGNYVDLIALTICFQTHENISVKLLRFPSPAPLDVPIIFCSFYEI